jgi:putative hemolysin
LIGTVGANYLVTVAVAYLLTHAVGVGGGLSEVYTTLLVTPVVFVFGEVVPKNLFQRDPDRLMFASSRLLYWAAWALRWPVAAVTWLARSLLALFDPAGVARPADARANIARLLHESVAAEDTVGHHSELIDRVLKLSGVVVRQVMVPQGRVACISAAAGRKALQALARQTSHSRLPVFEDQPRRITGYVKVHRLLADGDWTWVRDRARPIVSLSGTESVASAIVILQTSRETISVVTDRAGLMIGLVTLKDLLEELTGELHDW